MQTAGSAVFTDVTVYDADPNNGGGDLDIVASWSDMTSNDAIHDTGIDARFDREAPNLWAELVPDAGSDNDYELKARVRP